VAELLCAQDVDVEQPGDVNGATGHPTLRRRPERAVRERAETAPAAPSLASGIPLAGSAAAAPGLPRA
jgi:hypothetical protein